MGCLGWLLPQFHPLHLSSPLDPLAGICAVGKCLELGVARPSGRQQGWCTWGLWVASGLKILLLLITPVHGWVGLGCTVMERSRRLRHQTNLNPPMLCNSHVFWDPGGAIGAAMGWALPCSFSGMRWLVPLRALEERAHFCSDVICLWCFQGGFL